MKWIGEYDKPDVIMIPIGGHFVMSPKDAAVATEMIKPKFEYLQALGTTSVKVFPISPGDKLTFP